MRDFDGLEALPASGATAEKATNFSAYLRRLEGARKNEWGHAEFGRIKGIKLPRR